MERVMTLKKFLYSFLLFEILYCSPLNAVELTGEIEPSAQSDFTSKATEILTNLYETYGTIDHFGNSSTADKISESLNKILQIFSMDTDCIDFQVLGDLINSASQFPSEADWAAKKWVGCTQMGCGGHKESHKYHSKEDATKVLGRISLMYNESDTVDSESIRVGEVRKYGSKTVSAGLTISTLVCVFWTVYEILSKRETGGDPLLYAAAKGALTIGAIGTMAYLFEQYTGWYISWSYYHYHRPSCLINCDNQKNKVSYKTPDEILNALNALRDLVDAFRNEHQISMTCPGIPIMATEL
jgi:hypothetical protein